MKLLSSLRSIGELKNCGISRSENRDSHHSFFYGSVKFTHMLAMIFALRLGQRTHFMMLNQKTQVKCSNTPIEERVLWIIMDPIVLVFHLLRIITFMYAPLCYYHPLLSIWLSKSFQRDQELRELRIYHSFLNFLLFCSWDQWILCNLKS